jgi:hypothetical protein
MSTTTATWRSSAPPGAPTATSWSAREALLRAARGRGLETMEGLVLARNPEMLRFVRALGFEVERPPGDRTTVRIVKRLR